MFYGEKLKALRELNGLSRKELAGKINVTEQAVWQFENQYTAPKFEIVNELKKYFSVKSQFFYTDSFVENVTDIERIAYRAEDRDSRKKAKMEITYINFISHFISKFETPLTLPAQNIYSLRKDIEKCLYDRSFAISKKDIERAASIARKKLGVSENKELLYRLELSGIYILEKSMGLSIDAYSTWTNKDIPFIILGTEKKSSVRRNFDLAHELGHLLMHKHIDMDSLDKKELRRVEHEANDFASYFLLPKDEFIKNFQELSKKSNPDSYIELKMKYHVSIQALEYRAYKLNLLSFEENRYFYSALNRMKYKVIEPLDEDIPIVRPGKVRALLSLILENNLLSLDQFLDTYSIDSTFLESLLGIDEDVLKEYKGISKLDYFDRRVITML
ncbi:spr1629 family repressor/antitoxin [Marinilactibacillus psychrotolerans]|uniref:ImmA/IrrE family metallo-endopeptidase n=1 Tax=Marinilactibacillus psychrotolerans TaxID=191770 RepID=A0A5R9BXR7_9LACT|nr:XRE family transcriptional regulator [Marinilactibacillus psychrotolerans]TLQ05506.1 ImmA/IrrE family metallo-endopeptidase [Marinilactibacillus psychrotolerans]GEQ32610.1 transcriptional regulator [Marinilactibacillus psychrotolerans]